MGHERLSKLPKTKKWQSIVDEIYSFDSTPFSAEEISSGTLRNVKKRYERIHIDKGVIASYQFLVNFALISKDIDTGDMQLDDLRITTKMSPLEVTQILQKWVKRNSESQEYAKLAQSAAIDAIVEWYKKNNENQFDLFSQNIEPAHDSPFDSVF